MRLSVLICTYNRSSLLSRCLTVLIERSDEAPDQVIVVNGGDGRADLIVEDMANRHHRSDMEILLIKTVNKNLAASRNVGLPHCTGDIIAMTDDDAEVFPDWVSQIKRLHGEHPEAGIIGGPVFAADTDSLVSRIADQVTFARYPAARAVRTLPGVNASYKRQAVERAGRQDESLFRGEDVDYNWRIKKLGYEVLYDPAIRVLHHHRPTLRGFLIQHYMYGRAYFLVRRKWQDMYCVYPHALRGHKEVLKAANFVAAAFYEPLRCAAQMEKLRDKILGYPLFIAQQFAWRSGMVCEKLHYHPQVVDRYVGVFERHTGSGSEE